MKVRDERVSCRVKEVRQSRGLSQTQMAELVGVKRQAIYDIESGLYMPNTAIALRLARTLGCRVEDLFSEETLAPNTAVTMAEGHGSPSRRVSVAKVRGQLIGYPVGGSHTFSQEVRAADGVLEEGGGVRLFTSPEYLDNTAFLLGCDPAFSLLAVHVSNVAPKTRVAWRFASSHSALEGLAAGHAHLAGTHLHSASGSNSNVKLAHKRLSGFGGGTVVGFSVMSEGLMVARGNPRRIRSVDDLASEKVRFVNRERGAALRILLDDKLSKSGIPPERVKGYDREVHTHNEGAQRVVYRAADAALGLHSVAEAFGLDFVPMAEVRCDLVIPGDLLEHPAIRVILDVLQSRALREDLASLPGYDASQTGTTIAEIG